MEILRSALELEKIPGPVFLAIGVFDGVHLGHRAVIERALKDSRTAGGSAVVVTFDPHPMRILRPEIAPRLITATQHKILLIESLGVNYALILPFTKEFAATPPDDFIRLLSASCHPLREICVGHSWEFGKNRAGNLKLLGLLGEALGFEEVGVEAVTVGGEIVSSTLIRHAVRSGDLQRAANFLGRQYSILGTVEYGEGLGKQIGCPTANLSAHSEQFPPDGVYAVNAVVRGRNRPGIVNLGRRPTVSGTEGKRVLELHIFDLDEDLYGEEVEVFFQTYLRPEIRFPNISALKSQIARDIAEARGTINHPIPGQFKAPPRRQRRAQSEE
jgi:riboflavin kinase/FMN adenylyltransferase